MNWMEGVIHGEKKWKGNIFLGNSIAVMHIFLMKFSCNECGMVYNWAFPLQKHLIWPTRLSFSGLCKMTVKDMIWKDI